MALEHPRMFQPLRGRPIVYMCKWFWSINNCMLSKQACLPVYRPHTPYDFSREQSHNNRDCLRLPKIDEYSTLLVGNFRSTRVMVLRKQL